MQSEIGAEWLGYIESAISLRLWIYRIENLSLVCPFSNAPHTNLQTWPYDQKKSLEIQRLESRKGNCVIQVRSQVRLLIC